MNTSNIARLKVAWMYQIGTTHHFETMPLVFDGVMYITEPPSDITALDLRTGRAIWKYTRALAKGFIVCCGQVDRGVAALDDQIFVGTVDSNKALFMSGVLRSDFSYCVSVRSFVGRFERDGYYPFDRRPGPGRPYRRDQCIAKKYEQYRLRPTSKRGPEGSSPSRNQLNQ